MKRFSFIAAALLCFVTMASAAIRPAQPGIGGGGSTTSGSITGAYSFNGGLSTVNATNVYLAPAISNLVLNPVLGYATNYIALLSAYTNIITVNASNSATAAGINLTNIATKAPAGSLVIVNPGRYFIPTNQQSIAGRGVDMYFHPGAIVAAGDSGDTATDNALFEDALAGTGATTNRIMGYGEFYTSNTLGRIILVSDGASDLTFECKLAWALGSNPVIDQSAGSLNYMAHDFTRAELYDVFTGGTAAPKRTVFKSASAYAGDSLVELNAGYTNWGDGVFTIGYGEALAGAGTYGSATVVVADNSIMDIQVLNFKRSKAAVTGLGTNKNQTGSGILRNTTIYSLPASTFPTVVRHDANNGTEFRMLNCTIYGPTGVDPIDYTTATGKFTLENTRVITGANATNAIRAGTTGSRMELIGLNSLDKPRHANVTTIASTNYATTIDASKLLAASAVVSGDIRVLSNLEVANGVYADALVMTNIFYVPYLYSSAVPDGVGSLMQRSNAWATGRGTLLFNDQTADVAVVGTLLSDTPSNGQVPTWNTGGTITWETPTGGSGSSNYVTLGVGSIAVTNSSSVGSVALNGTNSVAVTIQAANSNSVALTQIVGILHKASASVIVLDCNHGNRFQVTNRLGQGTTFVVTNLAQGQEITIKGSADGTSRSVTVVPQLGFLVRDFDAFGAAAALNKAITATNGNTFEINIAAAWEHGTNWADVVTRQATY